MFDRKRTYEVRRKKTGQVLYVSEDYEDARRYMQGHRGVELVLVLRFNGGYCNGLQEAQ